MIVDTSALIAILRQEPDADIFARAIDAAEAVRMSSGTFFEASIVADRFHDPAVGRQFGQLCRRIGLAVIDFDREQARIAREAYRDFGRGSGHAAKLNFGDCFAYALAKTMDEPLLYKGQDFSHTDVKRVLP